MRDHNTFEGAMPASAETRIMSLPCSFGVHEDCDANTCTCPCHEAVNAA